MKANNAFEDVNANKHFITENLASHWWLDDNHEIETIYCLSINIFVLKGLWHASAHVRHFDFWSGEPFFKLAHRGKKSSSIDRERPEKAIMQVLKNFLKPIFCIFMQALSRNSRLLRRSARTKPYLSLSVFLQTPDQMWSLIW